MSGWHSGTDIAIGAEGRGFDSLADQIGHSVANGSPPLRRFFCVAQVLSRGDGPANSRFGALLRVYKQRRSDLTYDNNDFSKRYSWELVSNFITNNTAKIQLKILGRTFRLTSGAIVNAKNNNVYNNDFIFYSFTTYRFEISKPSEKQAVLTLGLVRPYNYVEVRN